MKLYFHLSQRDWLIFSLPENVKNLPSWVNPNEDVGNGYELEVGLLGVGKVNLKATVKDEYF